MDNMPLIKVETAAQDLNCCRATLYRAINGGLIPAVRIGRCFRLEQETVQNIRKNGLPRLGAR
jgi:excisionase family DNA binding protein